MLQNLTLALQTQAWRRVFIVSVVLLVSALAAYQASPRKAQLLLLGIPALGAGIVLLRWSPLGLIMLVGASLVVPFAVGTGTQTNLNVSVLLTAGLLGLWLFDMVARRREIRINLAPPTLPLIGLSLTAALSFLAGQLPWFSGALGAPIMSQLGGLAVFILSAGAFTLVAHQVNDLVWLKRLTWLFLTLGGVYILGRVIPQLGTHRLFQPGAAGSVFWTWLTALAFSQAVFNRELKPGWRLALGGLVAATLYIGFFKGRSWASGWLPPIISVAAILFLTGKRISILLTIFAVVLSSVFDFTQFLLVVSSDVQGTLFPWQARLAAWEIVLNVVKQNPLLGLGPSNYYHYVQIFPILGYYIRFNSHNNYVDIIAQVGLLGFMCFIWFIVSISKTGWKLRDKVEGGFSHAYVIGCLGGLGGTLAASFLGDWFLPFVYNIGLKGFRASILAWIFLGGLVALQQITNRGNEE